MDIDATIGNDVTMRGGGSSSLGRIDQYELLRELGGGGFGCVYLAKDTVAGIEVAVKGLPPEVKHNKEELENIRANFALVSRLHHPNIAAALVLHPAAKAEYASRDTMEKLRVFERDTMMVMEYAPGVTLSQWRKQFSEKKVPLDKALDITRQVAAALDYAHGEKIVHRDVKPSNVMIETKPDGSVVARVLDFGLAAEIRSSMGRVSREIRDTSGTRPYMAPEQWRGAKQGPATDQYALAAMFCELVTGEVPFASVFDTGDPVVMLTNVTTLPPELPDSLPRGCRKTLLKALAKKPEERFGSCTAFADALGYVDSGASAGKTWIVAVLLVVLGLAVVGGWWWREKVKSEELRVKNEALAAERTRQAEERRRAEESKRKAEEAKRAEEARIAAEKAEAERRAKAEAEHKTKVEAERIAAEKAEAERKAKVEAERVAEEKRKAEEARVTRERELAAAKAEIERLKAEKKTGSGHRAETASPERPVEEHGASVPKMRKIVLERLVSPFVDTDGFAYVFNGKDLSGWFGTLNADIAMPGKDVLNPGPGAELYSEHEYDDFIMRFEFSMPQNAFGGLDVRVADVKSDPTYCGMCRIPLIDDGGTAFYDSASGRDRLKPWQYTGSLYGMVPCRRDNVDKQIWGRDKRFAPGGSYLLKAGTWNFAELIVKGTEVEFFLNGYLIVKADVSRFSGNGDTPDGSRHSGVGNRRGRIGLFGDVRWRNIRIRRLQGRNDEGVKVAPKHFDVLFGGTASDLLDNWKGVTTEEKFDNPFVRQAATVEKNEVMQRIADLGMRNHWTVRYGSMFFDGFKGGYSIATRKQYGDFEMYVDWRLLSRAGDSGLYLRGAPQVQIWDSEQWESGSGALYNNKKNPSRALVIADHAIGTWNTFRIIMRGERVSIWLNEELVTDNVILENYWDRAQPIFKREQIELQAHGDPVEFRNIFIRDLDGVRNLDETTGIPLLKDIPGVGNWLFGRQSN